MVYECRVGNMRYCDTDRTSFRLNFSFDTSHSLKITPGTSGKTQSLPLAFP